LFDDFARRSQKETCLLIRQADTSDKRAIGAIAEALVAQATKLPRVPSHRHHDLRVAFRKGVGITLLAEAKRAAL
jgi:hypothetical protein